MRGKTPAERDQINARIRLSQARTLATKLEVLDQLHDAGLLDRDMLAWFARTEWDRGWRDAHADLNSIPQSV